MIYYPGQAGTWDDERAKEWARICCPGLAGTPDNGKMWGWRGKGGSGQYVFSLLWGMLWRQNFLFFFHLGEGWATFFYIRGWRATNSLSVPGSKRYNYATGWINVFATRPATQPKFQVNRESSGRVLHLFCIFKAGVLHLFKRVLDLEFFFKRISVGCNFYNVVHLKF